MIIVSDTTPLHYLILINRAELLAELFGEIIIPEAVYLEISHERTPSEVLRWMQDRPEWLRIESAPDLSEPITGLGRGETEAIAIALTENADALLMDDKKAFREARRRDLTVITTLGILELAAAKGSIDLPETLNKLALTNFRLPADEIVKEMLKRDKARKLDDDQ